MAPSKKPLFAPPPPATLDQFFTKADASSSSAVAPKRVKIKSSSRIKQHTPAEIIILDSDDDDSDAPVPVVRTARKRKAKDQYHASSSSDIEVVEIDEGNGKRSKTVLFPALDESLHFAEFGRPKLLVDESSVVAGSSGENGVLRVPAPTSSSTICLEDEWGTGDDELNLKGESDDVLELTDDDEVEDALKPHDDNLDQCPFCSRSLSDLSPLVSPPLFFLQILLVSYMSRTYNHTLMTAVTPFLVHHHHHHHGSSLNAKSLLTVTRSRSSCPRARRTTHRRKPRWPRAARRKRTGGSGEKRRSTRSCRACPSPSMLSVMV